MKVWTFLYFIKEGLNPKKPKMSVWEKERKGVGGYRKSIFLFHATFLATAMVLAQNTLALNTTKRRAFWGTGAFLWHQSSLLLYSSLGVLDMVQHNQPASKTEIACSFIWGEFLKLLASMTWQQALVDHTVTSWQQALGSRLLGSRNGHRMIETNMFDSWLEPHN